MIKKEFKMLRRGDRVEYIGKGRDKGVTGIVDEIYGDGSIAVVATPLNRTAPFYMICSYKFWKFMCH